MKLKLTIGGNDRLAIVLSADHAAMIAGLLASATVYELEGYTTPEWKPQDAGLRLDFVSDAEFSPADPKLIAAQKEAERKSSDWYGEYTKRQAAEKELAETKSALAALQAVTVCTRTDDVPA